MNHWSVRAGVVRIIIVLCIWFYGTVRGADVPAGVTFGSAASSWNRKVNVTLQDAQDGAEAVLQMGVDASSFSFGWISTALPEAGAGYAMYDGIYGRFRAKSGNGRLTMFMILPRGTDNVRQYYRLESLSVPDSSVEWTEFYVPFQAMRGDRNVSPGAPLSSSMLSSGDLFELHLGGITGDRGAIELRDFRLLSKSESGDVISRLRRQMRLRRLKPDASLFSLKPRLLLTPERVKAVRAKATAGGVKQAAYEALIHQADVYLDRFPADAPFRRFLSFEANSDLTPHQQRGRFEGQLVPAVRPIEVLAACGILTGDERYSRHAARALVSMARSLTVEHPQIDKGFYYTRTFYVRALALGYDWLRGFLTPEERRDVKLTLLGFVEDIYEKSQTQHWGRHPLHRVWNWDPGLVSCAGLGVMALEGETHAPEAAMLMTFRRHLRDYLTLGIDYDGCGHEGPSYLSYGFGAGPEFMECLRERGLGDFFTGTNFHLISPWIVSEILPSKKTYNNLSDCNSGKIPGLAVYSYAMGRYAELAKTEPVRKGERHPSQSDWYERMPYIGHFRDIPGERHLSYGALASLMGWAWDMDAVPDVRGYNPSQLLAHVLFYEDIPAVSDPSTLLPPGMVFRGRGLAVSRDGGFGKDGVHLAVEAGPHAAGHDQADKGTFTLRAYGGEFFIDSGYGNDGNPLASGSAFAHNVVLCDGVGQPCRWHNTSDGYLTGYHTSATLDWIRVDALDAWNSALKGDTFEKQWTDRRMQLAERHIAFIRGTDGLPAYVAVYDNIAKQDGKEHEFTWQWHYPSGMEVTEANGCFMIRADTAPMDVLTSEEGQEPAERAWGKQTAVFTFTVPKTGSYRLIGKTFAGGNAPGKSDSFSVQAGDVRISTWDTSASPAPAWSEVCERGEVRGHRFELTEGSRFAVTLIAREPETCLTKLLLLPYDAPVPLDDRKIGADSVLLTARDAVLGTPGLLRRRYTSQLSAKASATVYPAGRISGRTTRDIFQTSREGQHPRLLYSVRAVNPNFVFVIVPKRSDESVVPVCVTPLSGEFPGTEITWPDGRSDRLEWVPAKAGNGSRTFRFTRRRGETAEWGWTAADAMPERKETP